MTQKSTTLGCIGMAAMVVFGGCRGMGGAHRGAGLAICCPSPAPAVVDVGGQVQAPTKVDVSQGRVTLRKALMAAGGARESIVAQAVPAAQQKSPIAAQLDRLVDLFKEKGKYKTYKSILEIVPAAQVQNITDTLEEVEVKLGTNQVDIDSLKKELLPPEGNAPSDKVSLSEISLDDLESWAVGLGRSETLLSHISWLQAYPMWKSWDQDKLARSVTQNQRNVSTRLSAFGKPVGPVELRAASVGPYFVALERADSLETTYYFPYDMVVGDQPGEILMKAGDSVQVVELRNSPLMSRAAGASPNPVVAIQGLVKEPGIAPGNFSTIGEIQNGVTHASDDPRGAWVLVRSSNSGLRQNVFVLPDSLVAPSGAATSAPTADGDIYLYTTVPRIPILVDSAVRDLVNQAVDQSVRECAPKIRNTLERHREVKQKIWEKWRRKLGGSAAGAEGAAK